MYNKVGYFIILALFVSSCGKDNEKWVITEFNETRTVRLEPYAWVPYALINIKVKGYVNDSIKITKGPPYYDIKLSGKVDTIIKNEYYGEGPVEFTFDPYKAKEGTLEIYLQL